MKLSILSAALALVASVVADPPSQISFPRCGMNEVIKSIASSGCGLTDVACLCVAKSFKKMANGGVAKVCKDQSELKVYLSFINAQCLGQPGYPVLLNQTTTSDSTIFKPSLLTMAGAAALAVAVI